eukprot:PhM_4_TR16480/c1_g1_i2/m.77323
MRSQTFFLRAYALIVTSMLLVVMLSSQQQQQQDGNTQKASSQRRLLQQQHGDDMEDIVDVVATPQPPTPPPSTQDDTNEENPDTHEPVLTPSITRRPRPRFLGSLEQEIISLRDEIQQLRLQLGNLAKSYAILAQKCNVVTWQRPSADPLSRNPCIAVNGMPSLSRTDPQFTLCTHGGSDVVSSFFIRDGFWRDCKPIQQLMSDVSTKLHLNNPTVVDVGANIGACAMWLAASNNATVFAFEPMSKNVAALGATLELNPRLKARVRLIPSAASVVNATRTLYSEQGNLGNSAMVESGSDDGKKILKGRAPKWTTEEITTRRVDDYVQQHVHLMKLDCQGCEYKALVGARQIFEKYGVDVVRAEFDPGLIRAVGDDPRDVLRFLWKHNYVVFDSEKRTEVKPGDEDKFTQEHEGHAVDIVAFAPAVKDLDLASGSDL